MKKLFLALACSTCFYAPHAFLDPVETEAQIPENDSHLQAIVDLNDELTLQTPSEFALTNFKDFFGTQTVSHYDIRTPDTPLTNKQDKVATFQSSWNRFIKNLYNKPSYAQTLSQDGAHINQFLDLSNELNLGTEAVYVCLRLFYNKMKDCEVIDDTVVSQVLDIMPERLEHHFVNTKRPTADLKFMKKNLENMLLNKFTYNMPQFKAAPDAFLSTLSQEIAGYFKREVEQLEKEKIETEARERLRTMIIKMFEMVLSKTVWQPSMHHGIWHSFKSIAQGLEKLASHGIIDHSDDLDDLHWALTLRFKFFLDLAGSSLPSAFYADIEHDLMNKNIFFLEYQEQDEAITSKKDTLILALLQAKTKALAYERSGIISLPLANN